MAAPPAIVLDNGSDCAKVGLSTAEEPRLVPNYGVRPKREKRVYIGDQVEEQLVDLSGVLYSRPFERGIVTDWPMQGKLWERFFADDAPAKHSLVVTHAPFTPASLLEQMDQLVFETFGFAACVRTVPAPLVVRGAVREAGADLFPGACVVVDCGHAFSHVTPVMHDKAVREAVRRVDVGGHQLTNHLKHTVSYRAWNMMEEAHLVRDMKHRMCYVGDMRAPPEPLLYVLPGPGARRGRVVGVDDDDEKETGDVLEDEEKQVVTLARERVAVPELLFHPSDVGLEQMGVAEAVVDAVSACPEFTHGKFYENIILTGGSSLFPGFRERLERDVRSMAPDQFKVRVWQPSDPVGCAWSGGADLARDANFVDLVVTKEEYEEMGSKAFK